jgi:Rrf2 family protein
MRLPANIRAVFTALVDVMTHQCEGRVRIADIVCRTGLPTTTVEQSFATLRKADILNVSRGPGGGFLLMNSPEDVSLFEVVNALDPRYATPPAPSLRIPRKATCHSGRSRPRSPDEGDLAFQTKATA